MLKRFKEQINQNLGFFWSVPVFIWQIFFFLIPLLFIFLLSFFGGKFGAISGLTFQNFFTFFTPAYGRIILRSLFFAISCSILCLFLAYPIAYYLVFKIKKFKNLFLFLIILPFWTSFLLHVYAWFFVLERGGFINTLLMKLGIIAEPLHMLNNSWAIAIMMVYYYFPFMLLPLYAILEKFDPYLIEASYDLGASWGLTMRKIIIPLSLSGILSGLFLVFVPAFAEFAIPELLGGEKRMFAGTVVSHFILGSTTISQGAAFTVISFLVLGLTIFVMYYCIKKVVKLL